MFTNYSFTTMTRKYFIIGLFVLLPFLVLSLHSVSAQNLQELEQQIQERAKERQELERQADAIRLELETTQGEKTALQAELNRINAERKSLDNTIRQTENQISSLTLKINKSEQEISRYSNEIKNHSDAIAALLRGMEHFNGMTIFEVVASSETISDIFSSRDYYVQLQKPLIERTYALELNKEYLYQTNEVLMREQEELEKEKEILGDQRSIIKNKEDEQNQVVSQVAEKESSYQISLQRTLQTIAALDAEIRDFESKLEFALNPNLLPAKGSAVLAWPIENVFITQRFGRTVSSERLYVSGSHSGVDFRAAVGTPIYSVADGIVKGVGDTDLQCPRASFGKWIFIEHDIGLSTTYGHLSSWKVTEGQQVKKGELIGYSGNTGHTTGPHLHLTVYATKGVDGGEGARVTERPSAACPGKNYRMPLAPTAAYLDPLEYLPATTSSQFKI